MTKLYIEGGELFTVTTEFTKSNGIKERESYAYEGPLTIEECASWAIEHDDAVQLRKCTQEGIEDVTAEIADHIVSEEGNDFSGWRKVPDWIEESREGYEADDTSNAEHRLNAFTQGVGAYGPYGR